jgi:hypothetical protein
LTNANLRFTDELLGTPRQVLFMSFPDDLVPEPPQPLNFVGVIG